MNDKKNKKKKRKYSIKQKLPILSLADAIKR